jgi:ABC-type phosphate transport system substrate-binding protein
MRYDSIGSGGGKARIKGEQLPKVHYAGSDILLTDEEQKAYPDLITFPTMAGYVVFISKYQFKLILYIILTNTKGTDFWHY